MRTLRSPEGNWDVLHILTGRRLAVTVNQFVAWYLRRDGARLPERPSAEDIAQADARYREEAAAKHAARASRRGRAAQD